MSSSLSQALLPQFSSPLPQTKDWFFQQLAGVEISLMEARSQVVSVLDREISEVRSLKKMAASRLQSIDLPSFKPAESPVSGKAAPLPSNVLAISRELFTSTDPKPVEMALDPELERATIDELNAALAAAFSHISAH